MAFGTSPGPPATRSQLRHLLALIEGAGHLDFRDARGPLGLTQRQAGGRFTRDEADALIRELEAAGVEQLSDAAAGATGPTGSFMTPRGDRRWLCACRSRLRTARPIGR